MKIGIFGVNPDLIAAAPWEDPAWRKWALPWGPKKYIFRAESLFEIHAEEHFARYAPPSYQEELRAWENDGIMVVRQENFPLQEAIALSGDYFLCTMAYMIAAAILEAPDEIGVFACDPAGRWAYQKPNVEHWIGVARGRGIDVTIQEGSNLCAYDPAPLVESGGPLYPSRYGWST
jgi:hypothetical protein